MRLVCLAVLLSACAGLSRGVMSLEQTFERPEGSLPFRFAFSPDGKRLAYLKTRVDGLSDLWAYDLDTGEHDLLLAAESQEKLTPEQQAARERRRDGTRGIGRYWWKPDGTSILLALSGDLHELRGKELTRLTKTKAPERDPQWAPDGSAVAYVRDRNVFVGDTQLTKAGGGTVSCGLAEFIAGEELGRHRGYWWSPDSKQIAYVEVDEKDVPVFRMHRYLPAYGKTVEQRYPRAGDRNARWELKVRPVGGGPAKAIDVLGEYLVRVDWVEQGLYVQTANRSQRRLTLYRCDPATGRAELVLEEKDDAWVRFHRDFRFLKDGRFLWSSERSGYRQLYVFEDGALHALTDPEQGFQDVVAVDDESVYVTALYPDPATRVFGRIDLKTGKWTPLGHGEGWHSVQASKDARWFVDSWSFLAGAPRIDLHGPDGRTVRLAEAKPLTGLPAPELVTIPADDGTELHGVLIRARRPTPGPAIVYCYGGPGSHLVADRWGGWRYLWHCRMAAKGYTILTVDNRGAGGYGRAFSKVVSGRLCDWEVRDQAAAARWLGRQAYVDAKRIGIWGWSYGGTLTMMCLLTAPDAFAAGVAVAPVTDWRDYDTAYTERYLGLPAENKDGYDLSSPITFADKLARPLLLAHGFMDDNVHFRGAVAFLDKAQRAGRTIEMDFYPRGAHGIGGKVERRLLFERIERFWDRHLR